MKTLRHIFLPAVLALTILAASSSVALAATTYEYKAIRLEKVSVKNAQQLELLLNQLGSEGWLLIQITAAGVAILQREK